MGANLIKKNSQGYGYKYTDLAEINKLLAENGITYYQYIDPVVTADGIVVDYVFTVPIVDDKELPARRGCRVAQAELKGISNPAQEQGSALTYARRYSLLMAFGLATTDDDGEALTKGLATDKQKKEFMETCKAMNIDYWEVLKKVGFKRGDKMTTDLLGLAKIEVQKMSEANK